MTTLGYINAMKESMPGMGEMLTLSEGTEWCNDGKLICEDVPAPGALTGECRVPLSKVFYSDTAGVCHLAGYRAAGDRAWKPTHTIGGLVVSFHNQQASDAVYCIWLERDGDVRYLAINTSARVVRVPLPENVPSSQAGLYASTHPMLPEDAKAILGSALAHLRPNRKVLVGNALPAMTVEQYTGEC